MLALYDGYQLKLSMFGLVAAVNDATDDTNAICLATQSGGGAHCAGIYYDGSSVKAWARWISWTNFYLAAVDGTPGDPIGTDNASKWYLLDPSMDKDITVTGTVGSNWSIYRFQATSDDVSGDYRLSPADTDVRAYIYVRDASVHTFHGGDIVNLQGGLSNTVMGAFVAASVLAYNLF